jgi:peptidoglycan/xylan/chitin deacetylase (PgdA/CDA1 family)
VVPPFLGGRTFWWDAIDPGDVESRERWRTRALTVLHGADDSVRAEARAAGLSTQTLPAHYAVADESDLQRAVATGLVTVGSHTWSHQNLASLPADRAAVELKQARSWLQQHFASAYVDWIAYPYGLYSQETESVAQAAGYAGAMSLGRGWSPPGLRAFTVSRLNVPAGLALGRFTLRVSGIPW